MLHVTNAAGSVSEETSTYSYEATTPNGPIPLSDQLVQAAHTNGQGTETFGYDANGNRNTNGFVPTLQDNRYSEDGFYTTYEYDGEGNLKKRSNASGSEEYVWDHRNRMTELATKDGAGNYIKRVYFRYDAFDRRIEKLMHNYSSGSVTSAFAERYFYDGQDLLYVTDGNGHDSAFSRMLTRYLPGPVVDQVFADETIAGELLWPLTDHQGTPRDFADNAGNIQDHLWYNAFGVPVTETQQNPYWSLKNAGSYRRLREGYTGLTWDVDVYFDWSQTRVYKPGLGRWMSQDPIGFAGGDANLYRYVGNSPANFVDPSGLEGTISNLWNNVAVPWTKSAGTTYKDSMELLTPWGMYRYNMRFYEFAKRAVKEPGNTAIETVTDYVDSTSRMAFGPYRDVARIYWGSHAPDTPEGRRAQSMSARDGRDAVLAGGVAAAQLRAVGAPTNAVGPKPTAPPPATTIATKPEPLQKPSAELCLTPTQGSNPASSTSRSGVFFESKERWTATKAKGTGQTYDVVPRNDIDWNRVRTSGDKRAKGLTNAEAAEKYGLPPQLPDGNFATLHHLGQDARGGLVEASTRYHGVGKPGQDSLHSQFGRNQPHPEHPVDRAKFDVDSREYWKWREKNR